MPLLRRSTAPKATLETVEAAFSKHWGGKPFRPFQRKVISSGLEGRDTLGVVAVGSGKSAVFQAPALVLPGTVLVVSPLIALMKDQVDGAKARGIAADCINSSMDEKEITAAMARAARGQTKLLYVAPERLFSSAFARMLRNLHCSLFAVDEAHCASRYSSFRPAYMRIKDCIANLPRRPAVVALTATMTAHIEDEVTSNLGMSHSYARFIGSPVRPNLDYRSVWAAKKEWHEFSHVIPFLQRPGRHIVYTASRKGAEMAALQYVQESGADDETVGYYHAGMQRDERRRAQEGFTRGRVTVIFATVAFGMGVDIPNIRTVVNLGMPGSMEDVVQMGGRAGRDGLDALCFLIGSDDTLGLQERFINSGYPAWDTYTEVHDWLTANLKPTETMYLSAEAIIKRMGESRMKAGTYDSSAVGSVLHTMEAHGLVHRHPMSSASEITLFDSLLKATDLPKSQAAVADALLRLIGRPRGGLTATAMVESGAVADLAGVSAHVVTTAMLKLVAAGHIRKLPAYNGKATEWVKGMHDVPLTDILKPEEVTLRRNQELARLNDVVEYVQSRDPRKFICDYFAQPTETFA